MNTERIYHIKTKTWGDLILTVFWVTIALGALNHKEAKLISPHFQNVYAEEIKTPVLNPNLSERQQNISLIKKIWKKDAAIGLEIARCESGYSTKGPHVANNNKSVDQGVFSINSIHEMPEMENAVANISYAYTMYLKQGLDPWESSRSCWEGSI